MQFKYYKFVLTDTESVNSIELEVSPLHGDCDMYTSRFDRFPNKTDHEKVSVMNGNKAERVVYEVEKIIGPQASNTIYIGVYGYSYATYSIRINVIRSLDDENEQ